MKIFFVSDLHYDVAIGARATESVAEWLASEGRPDDVLLLGGDYANTDDAVRECLSHFASFPGRKLGIAGNHDVWVDTSVDSSRDRYQRLEQIFDEAGIEALEAAPVVIGGVGFVGALGWYDYSFRVSSLDVPIEVYERKGYPGLPGTIWNDGRNVNWEATDPDFTVEQLDRVQDHLERLSDEASAAPVERIIAMTHHVPTNGLLRPSWLPSTVPRKMVVPRKWLILNTYLGSQRFEELFSRYADRVEAVFCGHIHLARHVARRGIDYVSNGSDHKHKEVVVWEDGDLRRERF